MDTDIYVYALLGALAIALLVSIYTDIRYRRILNKVTLSIALLAPLYWYVSDDISLMAIGWHLLTAAIVFIFFLICFKFGLMGGGDVKLFTALALWFSWIDVSRLMLITAILGGVVTLFYLITHKVQHRKGSPSIPYGVAIAGAGLWIVCERLFNHFT